MEGNVAPASGQPDMADPAQQAHASSHTATTATTTTTTVPSDTSSTAAAAAAAETVPGGSGMEAPAPIPEAPLPADALAAQPASAAQSKSDSVTAPATLSSPTAPKPSSTAGHEHHEHRQHPNHPHHQHQKSLPERTVPHFVAPSSYLRPKTVTRSAMSAASEPKPPSPLDKEQRQGLKAIREFLKVRTSYDVLPLSFRLIVLDTDLLIKKTLNILIQNAIVSAPLWDSQTSRFAGLLTSTDFINVIQYYCQFPDEMSKLEQFRLSSLRDIEKAIGASPIETVSVHPSQPLFEACRRMLSTRARRIPLVDVDDETGRETVVSVITQYRILKFIAVNNEHNTVLLKKTVRDIRLGTYTNLATARMDSTVLDVIHLMVQHNISCVPIVDKDNRLLNAFEAVDVIPCIKGGMYEELDGTVGEALCRRPEDSPGIYTCCEDDRLDSLFDTIRKSRVHRLVVVDDDNKLRGVISLSDILKYVLIFGEEDGGSF
jgi:5'-AMP-activated protein kinase regulatory gamma subunit